MGIHREKFEKGLVYGGAISTEISDARPPCSLVERPTDEEAKFHGFSSGLEWYKYSSSGLLVDPKAVVANFDALPETEKQEDSGPGMHFWGAMGTGIESDADALEPRDELRTYEELRS